MKQIFIHTGIKFLSLYVYSLLITPSLLRETKSLNCKNSLMCSKFVYAPYEMIY